MFNINNMHDESSFEQFAQYCNERCCDGRWNFEEAVLCSSIASLIYNIEVRFLGILCKRKTKKAREDAWKIIRFVLSEMSSEIGWLEQENGRILEEFDYKFKLLESRVDRYEKL